MLLFKLTFSSVSRNFDNVKLSKLVNGIRNMFKKFDKKFPEFANRKTKSETVSLPEEYVGVVLVFRTFARISYALVMEVKGPIHVLDKARSL